jgi:hypothetical protein
MSRLRSLESLGDFCSLPSPHRIPQGVAGMAFNFSSVEVEPAEQPHYAAAPADSNQSAASQPRNKSLAARFGFPQYSPAT